MINEKKKKKFRGLVVFLIKEKKKKRKLTGLVLFVINEKRTKKKKRGAGRLCDQ